MDYKHLTEEQREQHVASRLLQLEAEHYQHSLNIEAIQLTNDSEESKAEQVAQEQKAIDTIEAAYTAVDAAHAKIKGAKGK